MTRNRQQRIKQWRKRSRARNITKRCKDKASTKPSLNRRNQKMKKYQQKRKKYQQKRRKFRQRRKRRRQRRKMCQQRKKRCR